MKIIKGDTVIIKSGKDKGRSGEVVKTSPKDSVIVVKGLNLFKKHIKADKNQKGGIIEKERPLQVSKVMLICPNCKKPVRVRYEVDKSGDKYRVCTKCKSMLTTKSAK